MERNAFEQQVERIRNSHSFAAKNQLLRLLEILASHYQSQNTLKPDRVMRELWPDDSERTSADLATARNRLRKALNAYYREEGSKDQVFIWLPRRGGEESAEDRMHAWIRAEGTGDQAAANKLAVADGKGTSGGRDKTGVYERAAVANVVAPPQAPAFSSTSRGWMKWAGGGAALAVLAAIAILLMLHTKALFFARTGSELYTRNPPAKAQWQYLRGRYFWDLRTADGLAKANDAYAQAIAIDPSYADAYAGLAESYDLLPQFGHADLVESLARAKSAADRAIALHPNLAAAHRAKGFALFFGDWDIAGSESEFRRALDLDPNSAQTHQWYASSLFSRLDGADSIREIDEARRLDPVSPAIAADAAFIHAEFDDYGSGVRALEEIEETQPTLATPPSFLQGLYFGKGDYQNYIAEARRYAAITHDPDDARMAEVMARGWASGGGKGFLEARASMLQTDFQRGTETGCLLGETLLALGSPQKAVPYFRASLDKRCLLLPVLEECGWPKALADSPGYTELFAEVRQRIAGWGGSHAVCPNGFLRPKYGGARVRGLIEPVE